MGEVKQVIFTIGHKNQKIFKQIAPGKKGNTLFVKEETKQREPLSYHISFQINSDKWIMCFSDEVRR